MPSSTRTVSREYAERIARDAYDSLLFKGKVQRPWESLSHQARKGHVDAVHDRLNNIPRPKPERTWRRSLKIKRLQAQVWVIQRVLNLLNRIERSCKTD